MILEAFEGELAYTRSAIVRDVVDVACTGFEVRSIIRIAREERRKGGTPHARGRPVAEFRPRRINLISYQGTCAYVGNYYRELSFGYDVPLSLSRCATSDGKQREYSRFDVPPIMNVAQRGDSTFHAVITSADRGGARARAASRRGPGNGRKNTRGGGG